MLKPNDFILMHETFKKTSTPMPDKKVGEAQIGFPIFIGTKEDCIEAARRYAHQFADNYDMRKLTAVSDLQYSMVRIKDGEEHHIKFFLAEMFIVETDINNVECPPTFESLPQNDMSLSASERETAQTMRLIDKTFPGIMG